LEEEKTYYHRHLPHYQPEDATFHVVFRLAGSLPAQVIEELKQGRKKSEQKSNNSKNTYTQYKKLAQRRKTNYEQFDSLLDQSSGEPHWLKEPDVAMIVKEAIHYRDSEVYNLLAYCIMPNHVHMLFELLSDTVGRNSISTYKVTNIIGALKKHTALQANRILQRSGAFWQHESYDHVIRDNNELENTLWYILFNPVKAGLTKEWEQWKWSYCKPELML
jgi:putative transposase